MKTTVGASLLIGGLLLAVLPGFFLISHAGPCQDLHQNGLILARTSIGRSMPIPVVQFCTHAAPLFGVFFAGYLIAFAGTLLLMFAQLSGRALFGLTSIVMVLAITMPFVPNTDPYAYAFYAYEGFVLKYSPFFQQHLHAVSPVATALVSLFPADESRIRIANYGPVFAALYSVVIGPFGLVSLKAMIFAERALGAIAVLLVGLLLSMTQVDRIAKQRAFTAIVLNPLVVFQSVSFMHGDIIMLALLVAAYVLYQRGQFWACAALCVLAIEVRFVAVAAVLVLFRELLFMKRYRQFATAATVTALTLATTWLLAERIFGVFRISGTNVFPNFYAPGALLTSLLLGFSSRSVLIGFMLQVISGAALFYASLRERLYSLVPVATLVGVPVFEPWYAQWIAPFAVLTSNPAFRAAIIAFMLVAPLQMFVEMIAGASRAQETTIALIRWLTPALIYFWLSVTFHRKETAAMAVVSR